MATTKIQVTATDNELILIASTPAGSSELLHYKSGYNKPVDVTLYPDAILPHGEYSLTMIGICWGGAADYKVTVFTDGEPTLYQKEQDPGTVGVAWHETISITV